MDPVIIRQSLVRLGFSMNAAHSIATDQGLNSLGKIGLLTDGEVVNLCKALRKPGGMVANPEALLPNQPAQVPNQGFMVSMRAENNLKLACYYLRHRQRMSRTTVAAQITLENVRALHDLKLQQDNHKDPSETPTINPKDWAKTMEDLREYLCGHLGITKVPLSYVVRENEAVVDEADDPSTNYSTVYEEMVARAPIRNAQGGYVESYRTDRERFWQLIAGVTRDNACWTYAKPAQHTRDGRLAFLSLYGHYLGVNNVDNMAAAAERQLQSASYTGGEGRRWTFEKFVRLQVEQHHILENLVQFGYAGIDSRSKVRHLLDGIKTTKFDAVKMQIMASLDLMKDFDRCVNLYKDFIAQSKSNGRESQIAAVITPDPSKDSPPEKKKKETGSEKEADMTVQDRYYNKAEYSKLTPQQKLGLKLKREKRQGSDGNNPRQSKKVRLHKASIKAIISAIKADSGAKEDAESESESESENEEAQSGRNSNRTNKALQKKKRK
jgi:hypothetical protein